MTGIGERIEIHQMNVMFFYPTLYKATSNKTGATGDQNFFHIFFQLLGRDPSVVGGNTLGRIRTCDLRFRKPLLYPLSYEGGYFNPRYFKADLLNPDILE